MGATKIPYLDKVYNPVLGCSPKMPCAARCWAWRMVGRIVANPRLAECGNVLFDLCDTLAYDGNGVVGWSGKSGLVEKWLDAPLHWRKPRRVGVCFLGDLFAEAVPDEWIDKVFGVMAECTQHQFYVLTKRAERMSAYLRGLYSHATTLPNVRLGVSVCDQDDANRQVPILQEMPAAFRWVSYEPALGEIDFTASGKQGVGEQLIDYLNWIVVGCESGPARRPMPWSWADRVVEQCKTAGVPCYVKQLDGNDMKGGKERNRVIYPGAPVWPAWARQEQP